MINYSLSYRNVKVADLDANGQKQYDTNGDLIKKTVQKAYATHQSLDTLSNDDFCKAVAAMGAYSKADIMSIVAVLAKAIIEQVKLGQRVYLGELGNYYPSLTSKGVEDANTFTPTAHIRKAYVGWVRPSDMRELSNVTYNLVTTRAAEAAMAKANKAALASTTLSQSSATQTAAQRLELIRSSFVLTTSIPSSMSSMGTTEGSGTYKYGTRVAIKALPNTGYAFTKWNDGDRNAVRNVTVTAQKSYVASFAADPGVVGTKICKEDNSDLAAGASVESIRMNFTAATAPAAASLTLVRVVDGVETAVSGAEWAPCDNTYGCFDFDSAQTVLAGKYRVLKGDVMVLEWDIA